MKKKRKKKPSATPVDPDLFAGLHRFLYVYSHYPFIAYIFPRSGLIRLYNARKKTSKVVRRKPFGRTYLRRVEQMLIAKQAAFRERYIKVLRKKGKKIPVIAKFFRCSRNEVRDMLGLKVRLTAEERRKERKKRRREKEMSEISTQSKRQRTARKKAAKSREDSAAKKVVKKKVVKKKKKKLKRR